MTEPTTLGDVVGLLEEWYPPARAESWDAVGLVCGDPASVVRRILLAVDPAVVVADEAVADGAQLVITHHPLYLRGTSSVAATTAKGTVVHRLLTNGSALYAAHTNADAPRFGVSESLALALGLVDVRPLAAQQEHRHKIAVFVPLEAADRVRDALAGAGAGEIGDYDRASFSTPGTGRFRPLDGATPAIGAVGTDEVVAEERIEVICPAALSTAAVAAMKQVHPYEEPAYDVWELVPDDARDRGHGRIGTIEPMTLRAFAERVADVLPATAHGVRVAGDPDRIIRTVALLGGAGDSHLPDARRSGADVYLTSDLRHHPAAEFVEESGPALIDVAHWAAEWTWLPVLADRLRVALGDTVEVTVSTRNTDPWTFRVDRGASS